MAETKPIDIPTRETAAFLSAHVRPRSTILEVGCGDGEVAFELLRRGYDVTAIDAEAERVARAQELGVRAVTASWPDFAGNPVDAIAFTRSLHHIDPLDQAVAKARELLLPGGALLVEDFAFRETDHATVDWFLKMLRDNQENILPVEHSFVMRLLSASDAMLEWQRNHTQALHSITSIKTAVAKQFTIQSAESAAYLYRYLVPVLPETAVATITRFLDEELRAAARGEISLTGQRIVATPKPPAR